MFGQGIKFMTKFTQMLKKLYNREKAYNQKESTRKYYSENSTTRTPNN